MLILIQTFLSICLLKTVLFQHFHKLRLQRYFVFANNEASVVDDGLVEGGVPLMIHDLIRIHPFIRIVFQDPIHQILAALGHPSRNFELTIQYLFIKFISIRVLKRQIATDHGEENDPTAPHVNLGPVIFFASDHFGCCIAR